MLSQLSAKVHPLACEEANFKDECPETTFLPTPSAPSHQTKSESLRWVDNYPRLHFVLLFICCTYVGGIYVSTLFTTWTLHVLGVPNELTTAREVYAATSHTLNTMSQCVERSSLEHLASAKLQYEADSKRVQETVNANDGILIDQRNATAACTNAFLSTLTKQIQATSPSNEANSTLNCFFDSFYDTMPNNDVLSSSRELILAVRAILTTQVALEANISASEQTNKLGNQLLEMWNAIDAVKTSIEKTINATNAVAVQHLSSLAPLSSQSDGSGHTQQSASRINSLSKLASSDFSDSLTSASTTSLEAVQKAGRTLHKALEFVAGLHDGFSNVLDTVDESWQSLEKQVNASVQMVTQLQKELVYAADSTAQQMKNTSTAVMTSLDQAQQEVSTAFNILRDRWHDTAHKMGAEAFKPWQRLGDQLVAELTANQRQRVRPENSIQRRYLLPDRTTNSNLKNELGKLATASRNEGSTSEEFESANEEKFDIDTAVLRASLVDVGAFVTRVIFYVDVGRLALLIADLAVGLITESYFDMPVLDIRGISTVETIGSVWEVLLCHHSLSAVCVTLVANATGFLRVLVTFLFFVGAASVITAGLYMWKNAHIAHCLSNDERATSQTTIQSITRAFYENKNNTSKRVLNPLDAIQKYTTISNDSIRGDYAALTLDSAVAWKNQSSSLKDLEDCVRTSSRLVRMFQDCTTNGEDVRLNDASISSQCLTSSLSTNTTLVNLLPLTEALSENAPFLEPSTAFKLCFPSEEHGEREEVVGKLQHDLACATEKAVYLSIASWWLLVVIFMANRFVVRMILKSAGVYWWRFLSANRLQFVGFCQESGAIVASEKLPKAIQQHLLKAKWQLVSRLVGIGFAVASVATIAGIIFHGIT